MLACRGPVLAFPFYACKVIMPLNVGRPDCLSDAYAAAARQATLIRRKVERSVHLVLSLLCAAFLGAGYDGQGTAARGSG
jgi:hypothetical protein